MFLSRRTLQAEYSDRPELSFHEVAENYRQLARINRLFLFADPCQRLMVDWLSHEQCRSLSILDLGAGDGSLGRVLTAWAERRGWRWEVTNLELNPLALRLDPQGRNVAGSVLSLPFRENSFDVVIASQMTHHLSNNTEVIQHFREAWRVTRDALFLNDLHRNIVLYVVIWSLLHAGRFSNSFRKDGLLSVRRGWRASEWQLLAAQAGITGAQVWLYYGARVMLQARKTGSAS